MILEGNKKKMVGKAWVPINPGGISWFFSNIGIKTNLKEPTVTIDCYRLF